MPFEETIKSIGRAAMDSVMEHDLRWPKEKGISANIDTWYRNKRHLIERLSRHPNWSEKDLAIVIDVTESREADRTLALETLRDLERTTGVSVNSDALIKLESRTLTEDDITMLNQAAEEGGFTWPLEFSVGQKVSRLIRKLFTALGVDLEKEQESRRLYAKYADAINPLTIVRPFAISVNPADYLLMSNGNSWSSCHDIEEGEWRAGTLSYMNDSSSVVTYTVSKNEIPEGGISFAPKVHRQMFHILDTGNMFIQSRLYPNGFTSSIFRQWRAVVQEVLSTVYGFENMWGKPIRNRDESGLREDNAHYPDYHHGGTITSYTAMAREQFQKGELGPIPIGEAPRCLVCGTPSETDGYYLCCEGCKERDRYDDDDY